LAGSTGDVLLLPSWNCTHLLLIIIITTTTTTTTIDNNVNYYYYYYYYSPLDIRRSNVLAFTTTGLSPRNRWLSKDTNDRAVVFLRLLLCISGSREESYT